jgi:hypothetical protein
MDREKLPVTPDRGVSMTFEAGMLNHRGITARQNAHLEVKYLAWMVRPIPTSSGGFEGELAITPVPNARLDPS